MSISQLKVRAVSATGSLSEMLAAAEAVAHCPSATPEQVELAAAAVRSIRAELKLPSDAKHQVALIRFGKLVSKL